VRAVYRACVDIHFNKLHIFLHSYELLAIFWAVIYLFSLSNVWKSIAIGVTQHIIIDQFTNPIYKRGYFLTYRAFKGFRKDALIIKDKGR